MCSPVFMDYTTRRLIVLAGARNWCRQSALRLLDKRNSANSIPLWLAQNAPPGAWALPAKQAGTLLGRELTALVYDAHSGFDPDAFGAVSGTVIGGGVIVLLTPPLDHWSDFPDPEYERIIVSPYGINDIKGRFLRRLCRIIQTAEHIEIIRQNDPLPRSGKREYPGCANVRPAAFDTTPDQQQAIGQIIKVLSGRRRRPLVLISDRGRGKSAALGIAAATLLTRGCARIVVTGPRLKALDAVFRHAQSLLPGASLTAGRLRSGAAAIDFIPPDELLRNNHQAELLLVDEAAAIPTPVLEALLRRYSRIAFATTIHGYEGNGRGFAVRFQQVLDKYTPGWKMHRLETPIRWAKNDPLERFVFDALMLDAAPAADAAVQAAAPGRCCTDIEQLDRDRLAGNEPLLRELFGLLVTAHYRTRPYDLRQLLDGPNLRVYVLRHAGHVIATALLADEGRLDAAVAHEIYLGRRRLRGHLIPQSLAAHIGLPAAALLRCARIMRIAVHPALQNKGFGNKLLQQLIGQASAEGFDWIGADFGATIGLLRFWKRAGLITVRLGLKREASSGAHSALVLKPLSEKSGPLFSQSRAQFAAQLLQLLPDALSTLDPAIAAAVLVGLQPDNTPLSARTRNEAAAFAFAQRGFEDSLAAICDFSLKLLNQETETINAAVNERERALLVAKVLQKRSWDELASLFALSGRGQGLEALRRILRQALSVSASAAEP